MSGELSPLGKVVLIQQMYGLTDEDTFRSDSGWILTHVSGLTIWHVSARSGNIRLGTNTRWTDYEVTEEKA